MAATIVSRGLLIKSVSKKMKFSDMLQSSPPRAYEGVRDLIMNLGDDCKKAVVRGSARKDVEIMLWKSLGKEQNVFDTQITAEDSERENMTLYLLWWH